MSETATINKNQQVGTLGDFMSQSNPPDSGYVTTTIDDFNAGNPVPVTDMKPLPAEHQTSFVKGVGLSLYQGFEEGSSNLLQFIGRGDTPEAKEINRKVSVLSQEIQPSNMPERVADGFAKGIGMLGPTLPVDVASGMAIQGAASFLEAMPVVSSVLNTMPSFAIGGAIRNGVESIQNSIKNKEDDPEASLRAVASAASTATFDSAFAFAGTGVKGFFLMPSISMASATYDAATQGRLPTRKELVQSGGEGIAYWGLFSLMPHLIEGTDSPIEKEELQQHTEQMKTNIKDGDMEGLKNTVETVMKDGNISPKVKQAVAAIIKPRYQVEIDPEGKVSYKKIEQAEAPVDIEGTPQGSEKESGLSKSVIQDAIKAGLKEEQAKEEELPKHDVRNMDDVGARASEFINNDHELAMKIAKREAPEQDDLRAEELFTSLRIKAQVEDDIDTLMELAHADKAAHAATEMGQRIKALDASDPLDVVKGIREVNKSREFEAKKKMPKFKAEAKKAAKALEKEINKLNKPKNWKDFVDSIEC